MPATRLKIFTTHSLVLGDPDENLRANFEWWEYEKRYKEYKEIEVKHVKYYRFQEVNKNDTLYWKWKLIVFYTETDIKKVPRNV